MKVPFRRGAKRSSKSTRSPPKAVYRAENGISRVPPHFISKLRLRRPSPAPWRFPLIMTLILVYSMLSNELDLRTRALVLFSSISPAHSALSCLHLTSLTFLGLCYLRLASQCTLLPSFHSLSPLPPSSPKVPEERQTGPQPRHPRLP